MINYLIGEYFYEEFEKKIISISLVLVLALIIMPMTISAGSISRTYSGQFETSWNRSYSSGDATILYGFNTFLINEDTCTAYHDNYWHNSAINNGSRFVGPSKAPGWASSKQVTHAGTSVSYYCEW